jgi:hypothetical protein
MTVKFLYPRQRQIEVAGAIYAGGMGVYIGMSLTMFGTSPVSWLGNNSQLVAQLLVTAAMVWAIGIRINGAWWFSPFLRLGGMLTHLGVAIWAIIAGAGSSASYTYGWIGALLLIGARNAAQDCIVSWSKKWAKLI